MSKCFTQFIIDSKERPEDDYPVRCTVPNCTHEPRCIIYYLAKMPDPIPTEIILTQEEIEHAGIPTECPVPNI